MKKAVLVINGAGGVGKDTLCDLAEKHLKIRNISTITPIKELARMCGWDGSKDGLTLGVWGCSVSSEASLTPRSGSWSFFAPLGVSWNIFTWPICVATWLPRGIMAWLNVNIQRAQREIDGILMTLLHKSRSITSALCTEIFRVSNIMPRKAASDMIYSTWVFCCCFLFITLENY